MIRRHHIDLSSLSPLTSRYPYSSKHLDPPLSFSISLHHLATVGFKRGDTIGGGGGGGDGGKRWPAVVRYDRGVRGPPNLVLFLLLLSGVLVRIEKAVLNIREKMLSFCGRLGVTY